MDPVMKDPRRHILDFHHAARQSESLPAMDVFVCGVSALGVCSISVGSLVLILDAEITDMGLDKLNPGQAEDKSPRQR